MSIPIARRLRRNLTPHEVRLWVRLRELRRQGLHFRRQVPVLDFFADFANLKASLLIEVDGSGHARDCRRLRDRKRDEILAQRGYLVLRFWNWEISENLNGVVETIYQTAVERISSRDR